ncbi:hypothetical protein C8J55DRAFT_309394 [Lentinula edodes]|uniref:WD40 repeat-like protein n=1 Tax=Lentinula lateritia TaxID=40482 RepID=A0A9W8ZQ52_9AGAR|nr:hypothetical protein C8J55DRAFT_309394 [Lentinula edodes]
MLLQPGEVRGAGSIQQPMFSAVRDDREAPTVDLQITGAQTFDTFRQKINNFDKELRTLSHAARQLGSSAAILSSVFHLRSRIAHILHLYRLNAADLYPRTVKPPIFQKSREKSSAFASARVLPHLARPVVDTSIGLEEFPKHFKALSEEIRTFINCLNEFPEFADETVNTSLWNFENDLNYWASTLKVYEGQFRSTNIQNYMEELGLEMGYHVDSIAFTLSMSTFIEVGVPTIRFAQKRGAANLLNLSTVATFFSAVTATTLQYSYTLDSTTGHVVNLFWFLSLVFSIAAAVNSLLGLSWKQAMYRSPGSRVPWWVLIWIKRSPLVFLVMSVVCFWIGLCTFTFASNQSRVTSIVTTVFTVFTSCSLGAISIWWTSERWSFTHRRSKEWLVNTVRQLFHLSLKRQILQRRIVTQIERLGTQLRRVGKSCFIGRDTEIKSDVESGSSPKLTHPNVPTASGTEPLGTFPLSSSIDLVTMEFTEPVTSREMGGPLNKSTMDPAVPIGKELWRNALRIAKMNRAMSNHRSANYQTHRQRTSSSTSSVDLKLDAIRVQSRLNALVPKLESLTPTQSKVAHRALIWNLQFSPDGKFLATSSWDKTSVIFRVQDSVISVYRRLAHPKGVVKQVAWSPGGHLLLTRLSRSINVWTQKTISRPTIVESIVWLPGTGEDFLSVEGSNVVRLSLNGKISGIYKFRNMNLQSIAVTPDGTRLLGVGTLLHSVDGLRPRLSRTEKRIAVYNIDTNQIETLVPVLSNVKGITVVPNSHNDFLTLISYEDKATPQLWKLDVSKNTSRLTIHQRYFPKVPTDFAGPSYFGGKNEELVLCVDKIGDLHIWDRESGTLLHRIRAHELGRDVTCIAWNHPHDPFMFATGSLHGSVQLWTRHERQLLSTTLRSASPDDMRNFDIPLPQQEQKWSAK